MIKKRASIFMLFLISMPMLLLFTNCSSLIWRKNSNTPICFRHVFTNDMAALEQNAAQCTNFETDNKITTLMMAASKGNRDMVMFLAANGANLEVKNDIGHTALAFAVIQNKPEIVKVLMAHGAKISPDENGINPVMMAIQMGRFEILKILNPDEKDVNLRAGDGWTALYFAIRNENLVVLDYLLSRGACTNVTDNYRQTPLDFAMENKWTPSFTRLKKARPCTPTIAASSN
jgi:ankyrin repeat protein